MTNVMNGVVLSYSTVTNQGVIQSGGKEYAVYRNSVVGLTGLVPGERVSFRLVKVNDVSLAHDVVKAPLLAPEPDEEQEEECEHFEFDHDMCLDCGYERDPGEAIDRAMDYYEGER